MTNHKGCRALEAKFGDHGLIDVIPAQRGGGWAAIDHGGKRVAWGKTLADLDEALMFWAHQEALDEDVFHSAERAWR